MRAGGAHAGGVTAADEGAAGGIPSGPTSYGRPGLYAERGGGESRHAGAAGGQPPAEGDDHLS